MRPQVCVVSVGILSKAIMEQVNSMSLPVDFILFEMPVNEDIVLPKELDNVDVFLSSGYRAQIIKQKVKRPVITIEISTYDILLALSTSIQYDEKPVILTYNNDYSVLNKIRNLFKIDIIQDSYTRLEDLEQIILKHKNVGRKCIIGSGMVCSLAEKHNLLSVFVFPQESIRTFIQIAADLAISIRKEIKNNKQLSTVINYANRGIVFTDHSGKIVICNPVAETFFRDKSENIVGREISSFFPNDELKDITNITETKINILVKIHGKEYVLNAIPVIHKNELENLVFFIDDISFIQKVDQQIRENIAKKGFVAKHSFENYNSSSKNFLKLLSTAKNFSRNDECIVISGETGTGKEILAQSIHNYSKRNKNPFVAVNCSAISNNLLESELFGYDEGAFTGAKKGGKKGLFEMAHSGTLFLDEIGEMSLSLQSKLLRVIQEKEVMHVGGTKMIPFDARIIVATNKNLWDMVQRKRFREDLYYRLNVLELHIPPLRERKEDIYNLFKTFLGELSPQIIPILEPYASDIESLLCSYTWPGNVRELENFAKMLIASLEPKNNAREIFNLINDIIQKKLVRLYSNAKDNDKETTTDETHLDFVQTFRKPNIQEIHDALEKCRGNQSKAAELLGISRVTLWRKLRKLNLKDK